MIAESQPKEKDIIVVLVGNLINKLNWGYGEGCHDEIKGEAIAAFVTLKEENKPGKETEDTLKQHVVTKIGAIARPQKIIFTADLPKTRSGKIMRRLLRDVAEGRALGDVTTLADSGIIESLKKKYDEEG